MVNVLSPSALAVLWYGAGVNRGIFAFQYIHGKS